MSEPIKEVVSKMDLTNYWYEISDIFLKRKFQIHSTIVISLNAAEPFVYYRLEDVKGFEMDGNLKSFCKHIDFIECKFL